MKKQFLCKVLDPALFTVCYLVFLAINMVQIINPMTVTRVFLALFALWGFAIGIRSYLSAKEAWTDKLMPVLFIFLAVCLAAELLNFSYGGIRGLGELCYFALCILVLYRQLGADIGKYAKILKWLSVILGAIISVMMLLSLWMYVNMISIELVNRKGETITIGFYINRLFGLFSSPNVGGLFALILVWCSLVTLYLRKGQRHYRVWIGVSVAQMILAAGYLSVALSRGANMVGVGFIVVFMMLRPGFAWEINKKTWQQFAIRAVTAVLALMISIGCVSVMNSLLVSGMKWGFSLKYGVSYDEIGNVDINDPNLSEDEKHALQILGDAMLGFDGRVEADRVDIDITNKRADIWKAHLSIMTGKNLLTGVNDPYLWYKDMTENGITFTDHQKFFIEWAGGNMHNGFLQILVNCGIFALLAMLLFIVLCFVRCLRYYCISIREKACTGERYIIFALSLPMVLCILGNNIVETNFVLMGANFFQALFWVLAGAAVLSAPGKKEGNK
jgi:hypothetical protein